MEDVALCDLVQEGIFSPIYDVGRCIYRRPNLLDVLSCNLIAVHLDHKSCLCRYAPEIEFPMFHFHKLINQDFTG